MKSFSIKKKKEKK